MPETRPMLEACRYGKKPDDYLLTRGNPPRHVTDERNAWHNLCVATGFGHWPCETEDCETEQTKQGRCPKCRARNWKYVGVLVHDMRRTGVRNLCRSGASEQLAMSISGQTSATFRRCDIVCNNEKALALAALAKAQARARKARAAKPAAPAVAIK